jgi:hypothetical protein
MEAYEKRGEYSDIFAEPSESVNTISHGMETSGISTGEAEKAEADMEIDGAVRALHRMDADRWRLPTPTLTTSGPDPLEEVKKKGVLEEYRRDVYFFVFR